MLTFIRSLARRFSRNRPGTLSREGNERMRRAYPQFAHLADEEMFAEVSKHIFQTTMDSLRSIRKKIKTADDLRQSGQYESAETVAMGALEEIASHDDMLKNSLTSDHAELFRLLGLICKDRHEDSRARQLLEKGLGIAKGGGFHRIIGMLSNDLGIVCLRLGETTIAEEYCMQSLEYLTLAKAAKTDLAVSNACLGSVLLAKGDPERAVGQFMAALRYCDQADLKSQASIYGNLGKAYAFLRKWEMAIDAMRQSQSIMEQVGSVTGMLINHHLLVNTYRVTGNHALAEREAVAAIDLATRSERTSDLASFKGELADCMRRRGALAGAIVHANAAAALFRQLGNMSGAATEHRRLADLLRDIGDLNGARQEFEKAKTLFEMVGNPQAAQECSEFLQEWN